MSAAVINIYERAARAEKVREYVELIDTAASWVGIDPHQNAIGILRMVLPGLDWKRLAVNNGVRPPSDKTIAAIRNVYMRRASR